MNRPKTHIILIEDDASIRGSIDMILSEHGFNVTCFSDPEVAFLLIKSLNDHKDKLPDLVITDINLDHDGVELIQKIDKEKIKVRILPITASRLDNVEGRDILRKPFSVEDLVERIQALLLITPV